MNYVHANGGWTGKKIDWDPQEAVGSVEALGQQRRTEAEREMDETLVRLKALIAHRHEDSDFEFDLEDGEDEDEVRISERPIIREAE